MKPEAYLEEYLRPIRESAPVGTAAPGAIPFLPEERYYCLSEPSHYIYNFTLDQLTRAELLRVLAETGAGKPEEIRPGQLIGWITERDRISSERAVLLVERERELAELHQKLQSPSYRVYRMMIIPLRMSRRLWHKAAPLASSLRRKRG